MSHRHRHVRLVVKPSRHGRDGVTGHKLSNEHDGPPDLSIGRRPAHVEAQVHFLERSVEWNGQAMNASVGEEKADETHESDAVPGIQNGALRNQRFEELGWAGVGEEYETLPPSSQKRTGHPSAIGETGQRQASAATAHAVEPVNQRLAGIDDLRRIDDHALAHANHTVFEPITRAVYDDRGVDPLVQHRNLVDF